MSYKIKDTCISCGSCEYECPVGAITQGEEIYEINKDICISCGVCASVCPVSAPEPE